MTTVTIDNKPYEVEKLNDEAKNQLNMLAATDAKIRSLQAELAICQTARNAYAKALSENLPKE